MIILLLKSKQKLGLAFLEQVRVKLTYELHLIEVELKFDSSNSIRI